jgi:hypothetical protein|eukprot:COSAG06_NODE_1008_length_11088_cov_13.941396_9_plen_55_part_00
MGMATAALEKNLTVQWCYATPTDILAALEMPAVTNVSVTTATHTSITQNCTPSG